jgi:hypothetical protein
MPAAPALLPPLPLVVVVLVVDASPALPPLASPLLPPLAEVEVPVEPPVPPDAVVLIVPVVPSSSSSVVHAIARSWLHANKHESFAQCLIISSSE